MNKSQKQLCGVLTQVIRTNKPMLSDYQVRIRKNENAASIIISTKLKQVRIPGNWGFERILLELSPLMDKICVAIEYDAHTINDNIDLHLTNLEVSRIYLSQYITLEETK